MPYPFPKASVANKILQNLENLPPVDAYQNRISNAGAQLGSARCEYKGASKMNNDLFEKATRLNETLFEQFSKAAEMQMDAFRRYADVTMEQAQKVSEVRDMEGLKAVTGDQAETLKSLSEQFSNDWKAWQDYFNETREQVRKVFEKAPEPDATPAKTTPKAAK
ncbi:phasin family protein [Marinobacter lipolyticus]|uniref:phasin family protein n=1 Tax=Marinobacter lipolyticus TaxID=209639 RepID=UPI003A8DABC7